MKPLLVLCLGNEVLSDDAFGFRIAEQLEKMKMELGNEVEIIAASMAGFNLLNFLQGRKKVLVVDTIMTGRAEPGSVHFFPLGDLVPSRGLTGSHEISLPTAITLARLMEIDTPEDIDVLAVEAGDVLTLSEEMTEPVRAAVPEAIEFIKGWTIIRNQEISHGYGNEKIATS
jgi:hydrogenase maturation protease